MMDPTLPPQVRLSFADLAVAVKGDATKFRFWGDGFIDIQTHLLLKFCFFSDFMGGDTRRDRSVEIPSGSVPESPPPPLAAAGTIQLWAVQRVSGQRGWVEGERRWVGGLGAGGGDGRPDDGHGKFTARVWCHLGS